MVMGPEANKVNTVFPKGMIDNLKARAKILHLGKQETKK
jgi:hypothetical protein